MQLLYIRNNLGELRILLNGKKTVQKNYIVYDLCETLEKLKLCDRKQIRSSS